MAYTISDANQVLKEWYTKKGGLNIAVPADPLYNMMAKETGWSGTDTFKVALRYGNPQAVSASMASTLTTAQAGNADGKALSFAVNEVTLTNAAYINRNVILRSTDAQSLIKATEVSIQGAADAVARAISVDLYGSKVGNLARISAVNGTVLTLTVPSDVFKFEIGMPIAFSSSLTGTSVDATTTYVTSRSVGAGTITVASATDATVNDYIFRVACKGASASGLAGWIPSTAPAPLEDFFGKDRSVSPEQLAGQRVDASTNGGSLEDLIIDCASECGAFGGAPDIAVVNFKKWATLQKNLVAKQMYSSNNTMKIGGVGFESISIMGPKGPINVVSSNACPNDRCYVLQSDTWQLVSVGKTVQFCDNDQLLQRASNSDAYEVRVASYFNVACFNPGANGVIFNLT